MSHNIDPEEIKKFDEFAKTWWDPNGSMSPLHGLTPIRIDYLLNFLHDLKVELRAHT